MLPILTSSSSSTVSYFEIRFSNLGYSGIGSSGESSSTAFGVLKFGFASFPGSSAGINIYKLGLAFTKFSEPLDCMLFLEAFEMLLFLSDSRFPFGDVSLSYLMSG